jgi:HEAT repeat protein
MDVSQTFSSGTGAPANTNVAVDPRLQPTPDYGTLGPSSDPAGFGSSPDPVSRRKPSLPLLHLLAIAIGIFAALLAGTIRRAGPSWSGIQTLFSSQPRDPASAADLRQLDRMRPQKQAETLLELAVGNTAGAVDQISSRVDRWQGQVQWNSQIASLSTAAMNSNDMRVRQSGIEVELAAYGLAKNPASLDYLLKTANSPNHAQKIWALWALGLMGNRGVRPDRVVEALTSHLADSDVDSRHWAVEGLALTGSDQTIQPLLQAMHDDPSPIVRERAACGLAQSGMFTQQQRLTAVPQLLNYTDDASLDAQTHAWAFQALNDITHQRLPNDSAAWRDWYQSTRND